MEPCFVCGKHRQGSEAQGGIAYEDDLVYVGHVHALRGSDAYRAWMVVEPKRHVPDLGDLTAHEAARVGLMVSRVAKAQRQLVGVEHVYSFVFGDQVQHLHVHVVPRYAGTPVEYWGPRIGQWPDSPRVSPQEMRAVCEQLASQLSVEM